MSEDKDYAHIRDPEAQRTRAELWLIVAIVAVVVGGALIWRIVAHKPAGLQKDWNTNAADYSNNAGAAVGAAAGVHPASPPPRPIAP